MKENHNFLKITFKIGVFQKNKRARRLWFHLFLSLILTFAESSIYYLQFEEHIWKPLKKWNSQFSGLLYEFPAGTRLTVYRRLDINESSFELCSNVERISNKNQLDPKRKSIFPIILSFSLACDFLFSPSGNQQIPKQWKNKQTSTHKLSRLTCLKFSHLKRHAIFWQKGC